MIDIKELLINFCSNIHKIFFGYLQTHRQNNVLHKMALAKPHHLQKHRIIVKGCASSRNGK